LFVFDRDGKQWLVYRYINFVPYLARAGTWTVAYDVAVG